MVDSGKRREATYQDVLDAPEHMTAELIDGELFLSPRPANRHATTMTYLSGELFTPFVRGRGGPGGWIILFEPEIHFGNDVLVPDLAGWRRERLPVVEETPFFTLRPDWICEGISKSTQKLDRVKKMKVYAREGVPHVWLLDARIRTLEVHRLAGNTYELVTIYEDKDVVRAEPFEELELRLADLYVDLPTRAGESYIEYGR